jgi:hypothetical protein
MFILLPIFYGWCQFLLQLLLTARRDAGAAQAPAATLVLLQPIDGFLYRDQGIFLGVKIHKKAHTAVVL